ncbi:hypothetical protein GCM10009087_42520 [Sphingomonas oligophenolica]|uniref:ThuA-like domain-containing protein n=1 Tax=Sphingomonas oligophenolica TaxID=301154 RepID=A0ABU9XZF4_9SPHN
MTTRILLQTTIEPVADDWNIARFSLLSDHLAGLRGEDGAPLYSVTARDREAPPGISDPVLATIDQSDFDELWLFAVDIGNGLNAEECAAIGRFRDGGGGLLVTRDHMDLGSSVCDLGGVGRAHHFHSHNLDPDPARRAIDDPFTTAILWPNFHSGANGDYQEIAPVGAVHPLLADPDAPGGVLRFLPAHPHEGDVSAPADDPSARVIATGTSKVTGTRFAIAVAFEPQPGGAGPAVAQSTFHHFADYNWDPGTGAPSFVTEAPGRTLIENAEALRSTGHYVANLALWLAEGRRMRRSEAARLDEKLDEALELSFPASDPIAIDPIAIDSVPGE